MRLRILWSATIAAILVLALSPVALAHVEGVIGPYTLEIGWVDEPPLVGVKNAVFISIVKTDSSEPVEDVNTLEVTVSTGGKDRKLELHPAGEDQPGQYAADFIPTRRGTYMVKLSGKIEDTEVNTSIDIEEVADAAGLQFPEPLPDAQALNQAVSRAEAAANSANTTALIAIALGVLGVLLGGFAALRGRRS